MTYIVGVEPGRVFSTTEYLAGKCPNLGTVGRTANGREFVLVVGQASQNLTNGHIVTFDGNHAATIASTNAQGEARRIGVAVVSITASASVYFWAQIFGPTSVQASLSALPNVTLSLGSVSGTVDDAVSSLSAIITGMYLTATSGVAGALCAAVLSYPRFQTQT